MLKLHSFAITIVNAFNGEMAGDMSIKPAETENSDVWQVLFAF